MKVTYVMFVILGVFFGIVALIYGLWTGWTEPVGPVGLVLSMLLALMIAYYLWFTARRMGVGPDDDPDGEIDQYQGDFGYFSPYSWQPLFLAGTAAIMFLGLAVGWWLFIIGASLGVFALIGWTFEYWKGENSL